MLRPATSHAGWHRDRHPQPLDPAVTFPSGLVGPSVPPVPCVVTLPVGVGVRDRLTGLAETGLSEHSPSTLPPYQAAADRRGARPMTHRRNTGYNGI